MREESVKKLLLKGGKSWEIIEKLLEEEKLIELQYMGHRFYMRKLPNIKR
jgi:hypothetical protein